MPIGFHVYMLVEFSETRQRRALPADTLARVSSLGSGQLVRNELFVMLTLSARI